MRAIFQKFNSVSANQACCRIIIPLSIGTTFVHLKKINNLFEAIGFLIILLTAN